MATESKAAEAAAGAGAGAGAGAAGPLAMSADARPAAESPVVSGDRNERGIPSALFLVRWAAVVQCDGMAMRACRLNAPQCRRAHQ